MLSFRLTKNRPMVYTIGDNIKVYVGICPKKGGMRIGFDAPRDIKITGEEDVVISAELKKSREEYESRGNK